MQYTGKYIDSFAAAMQMLFLQKGYGEIRHLDAMGKRCFGFCNGTDGYSWYLPAADVETAVLGIARQINLEGKLTAGKSRVMERLHDDGCIVYGPVTLESVVQRPDAMYYHGGNRFFYISREEESVYAVTDPHGFPAVLYTQPELEGLFRAENGTAVSVCESDGVHGRGEDPGEIWRAGLAFHQEIAAKAAASTLKRESFTSYADLSSRRIALWYGVINCIQQTEKAWHLGRQAMGAYGDERRLRELQSGMLKAAETGEIRLLPEIEHAIWKEIIDEISIYGL